MFDFEILNKLAEEKTTEIAFADEDKIFTFGQLNLLTRKIAYVLDAAGIKSGDLVCISFPSYLEWSASIALHLLGVTIMPKVGVNPFSPEIYPDWYLSFEIDSRFPSEKTILFTEDFLAKIAKSDELTIFTGYKDESQPARLFATSGTTGVTKFTAVTSQGLHEIAMRGGTHDFVGRDPLLSLFPLWMGSSYGRALKALLEGKTYFSCGFTDHRLPKLLRNYPIQTLLGSPVQISNFLEQQLQTGSKLPNLKYLILSGSTPTQQILDRINEQLDCQIINGYGSTEAGNVSLNLDANSMESGLTINPAVTLQIVDEKDKPLPSNSIGRIRYRRPGMSTSYYKNPEATSEFFKEGFFYPGDLGQVDDYGHLFLEGRVNELINLGGVKVNPEKIDDVVKAQLGVIDCAAFAVTMPSGIEELAMAVVAGKGFNIDILKKTLMAKSPWVPRFIVPTSIIPRNEGGKVLRLKLQEEFLENNKLS